jgi:hypothetical protein
MARDHITDVAVVGFLPWRFSDACRRSAWLARNPADSTHWRGAAIAIGRSAFGCYNGTAT